MKASNSFSNFPADLLVATGLPICLIAVAISSLLSLEGVYWIVAFGISISAAVAGAVLLYRAKLPLYRQRQFFTFGIQHIPQPLRKTYRWGCRLSIGGIALASLLLLGSAFWMGLFW
jgi:hypothetical protein